MATKFVGGVFHGVNPFAFSEVRRVDTAVAYDGEG